MGMPDEIKARIDTLDRDLHNAKPSWSPEGIFVVRIVFSPAFWPALAITLRTNGQPLLTSEREEIQNAKRTRILFSLAQATSADLIRIKTLVHEVDQNRVTEWPKGIALDGSYLKISLPEGRAIYSRTSTMSEPIKKLGQALLNMMLSSHPAFPVHPYMKNLTKNQAN